MTKMRFASKKRSDGSVYHFPINEYSKRPEKEITVHKSQKGWKSTISKEAEDIAKEILQLRLKAIKNNEYEDGELYTIKKDLEDMGVIIPDDLMLDARHNMISFLVEPDDENYPPWAPDPFTKDDYDELAWHIQHHLNRGETKEDIMNASDVKSNASYIVAWATLRAIEEKLKYEFEAHYHMDSEEFHYRYYGDEG